MATWSEVVGKSDLKFLSSVQGLGQSPNLTNYVSGGLTAVHYDEGISEIPVEEVLRSLSNDPDANGNFIKLERSLRANSSGMGYLRNALNADMINEAMARPVIGALGSVGNTITNTEPVPDQPMIDLASASASIIPYGYISAVGEVSVNLWLVKAGPRLPRISYAPA